MSALGQICRPTRRSGKAKISSAAGSWRPKCAVRWPSVRRQLLPKPAARTILRPPTATRPQHGHSPAMGCIRKPACFHTARTIMTGPCHRRPIISPSLFSPPPKCVVTSSQHLNRCNGRLFAIRIRHVEARARSCLTVAFEHDRDQLLRIQRVRVENESLRDAARRSLAVRPIAAGRAAFWSIRIM